MSSGDTASTTDSEKTNLLGQLRNFPRLPLIIGVAAAATVLVGMFLWSRTPDYAVLFSGMDARDGGQIIARLDQLQEPYKFAAGGSTILVPRADVDRMRLTLAGDGLPKGSGVGFELMDKQAFGVSEFTEKVNYNRALEGELARSIQSIDSVAGARIQLAIPPSTVFVRDRKPPTASVILTLYHGRALSHGQVEAIGHLVASAVPDLTVDAVTIVDSSGHLLSGPEHAGDDGADTTRLAYVSQIEDNYRKRVQALLAPILGADNVRAQVSADVDFSSNESTQEQYSPNQEPGKAAVRSEQRSNRLNGSGGVGGVPGALSNQPSPDQPSPINAPKPQGTARAGTSGSQGNAGSGMQMASSTGLTSMDNSNRSSDSSSTINYELDHVIRHVKQPVGRLTRLSVAVVINEKAPSPTTPAANARTAATSPTPSTASGKPPQQPAGLSQARMQQITDLVRSAVGYSQARGDSVQIVQMPFTDHSSAPTAPAAPPWWQDRQLQSMAITALKYLLFAIVAFFLWRRLVRPLLNRAIQPVSSTAPAAVAVGGEPAADKEEALRTYRRQQSGEAVRNAQDVAQNDPRLVAMIVKNWMRSDG
ncbi:MAG: flagellar basal-body MS-ring/collar protein FliF [Salinisphaera sp.]|jgi:flagellar M-ring protein FliF|nr:flagellar basal-body MS-ring/collar protein FliF [Salinisphaera sp.]